jgi:hypothetical protein
MKHPKRIGDTTAIAVMAALDLVGYAIAIPFGENTRYDLIADDGKRLLRVQCKTGRLRDGAVRFPTCSTYFHHRSARIGRRDYVGDIDAFGVYCPETSGVYLVPIEDAPLRCAAALRVTPPRNSQRRRIRFAADYELGSANAPTLLG